MAGIPRVDFLKKYSPIALVPEGIDAYVRAVDYAIMKGYKKYQGKV